MFTVDIDTGGTMTDGLVSDDANLVAIKVDTKPHDHTVSFRQVLVEAARAIAARFFDHYLGAVPVVLGRLSCTERAVA